MNTKINYPFDAHRFCAKNHIRPNCFRESISWKRIAILGGSTTAEVKDMLELFLLQDGISQSFMSQFTRKTCGTYCTEASDES